MHLEEHQQQHSLLADNLPAAAVGAPRLQVKVTDVCRDIDLVEVRDLAGLQINQHPTQGDLAPMHPTELQPQPSPPAVLAHQWGPLDPPSTPLTSYTRWGAVLSPAFPVGFRDQQ